MEFLLFCYLSEFSFVLVIFCLICSRGTRWKKLLRGKTVKKVKIRKREKIFSMYSGSHDGDIVIKYKNTGIYEWLV